MWPDSLVREIVEKRCIIHLGSGMSCQSVDENGNRPPSWEALLNTLKDSTLSNNEDKDLVDEFISQKRYLDAAEVIRTKGNSAEYNAKIREIFIEKNFVPSNAHKDLVDISPRIFLTTNYDTLVEGALIENSGHNSFTQYEHTRDGLLDSVRSPSTILIKMHGCAKHAADTILSRSDYFNLRKRYRSFFEITSSLYKLNTVLFIGCGIEDPDINLILENNNIETNTTNPSYAMVGSKSYAARIKDTIKSQYNIELITYEQNNENDHSKFEIKLNELKNRVDIIRTKYGSTS
ncbi:SIR2 family protein [Photobacterium sp. TLY01]|uniref:SIR2 family NAD-dependent protein deacylase n=1 Tax=Photobacterium sp. TLY01 TaxID=2907534 RepID=UPI001F316DE6|nr:SIR2 family protein [Photobacterium sp. TLY01]UIP30018.1 SIR2 family protein [Photobacterium sp. TLY01]